MSRAATRRSAIEAAGKPGGGLKANPDALGPGLREWFGSLGCYPGKAAVFDTKQRPAALAGRASKGVTRLLQAHDFDVIAKSASCLVTRQTQPAPQKTARARQWGARLAAGIAPSSAQGTGASIVRSELGTRRMPGSYWYRCLPGLTRAARSTFNHSCPQLPRCSVRPDPAHGGGSGGKLETDEWTPARSARA
jgi:hypothetical protein